MSYSFALCPRCNTWIPHEEMVYWYDDGENSQRACQYCLRNEKPPASYVKQLLLCPWCESKNTEIVPNTLQKIWRCKDCGETFGAY